MLSEDPICSPLDFLTHHLFDDMVHDYNRVIRCLPVNATNLGTIKENAGLGCV